jgi:AraC-like DNA-binding protein
MTDYAMNALQSRAASVFSRNSVGLPLSNQRSFGSSNVDEIREYMGALFCPHNLATSQDASSLNFSHYSAILRYITFHVVDYGMDRGSLMIKAPTMGGDYHAQFSLNGACEINQGDGAVQLMPGELFVMDAARPLTERISSDYVHLVMRIKRDALHEALTRELGYFPSAPIAFDRHAIPLNGGASSLFRMVSAICDDLDSSTPGLTHSRVMPHVEETLLSLLLNTLPHNYSELLQRTTSAPSPYYVRRAVNYIVAHAREPITLSDLVAASGVSARSLHAGFRQYKETTPMEYLRAHRLDLAKRELMTAESTGLSVTDVALGCGFNHLSKFAREYRMRFGVAPSQTRSGRAG